MALNVQKAGASQRAPIILIYGGEGIGKSTFGYQAPNPVFLQTEDGLMGLPDAATFGVQETFDGLISSMKSLLDEDHDFKTLVIDSLDHAEPLVWAHTLANVPNERGDYLSRIEDYGYAKGYIHALTYWQHIMMGANKLARKGISVVFIAHAHVKSKNDPDQTEAYDMNQIKLHHKAAAYIAESCDVIGYAHTDLTIRQDQSGKRKAVGGEERKLSVTPRASRQAKNRFGITEDLPLSFEALASHIPYYNQGN